MHVTTSLRDPTPPLFSGWLSSADPGGRARRYRSILVSLLAQCGLALAMAAAFNLRAPALRPWHDPVWEVRELVYRPELVVARTPPSRVQVTPAAPTAPKVHRLPLELERRAAPPRPLLRPAVALPPPPRLTLPGPAPSLPRPAAPPAPENEPSIQTTAFGQLVRLPPQSQAAAQPGSLASTGFDATTAEADPGPAGGPAAAGPDLFAETATPESAPAAMHLHGFDATLQPAWAAPPAPAAEAAANPPQILSWPEPVYTALAARERLEGEVVVRLRLQADGSVVVLGIVKALPDGLDESAVAAARQLRFLPARRDGIAVDWEVRLHVQFRLAY